MKKLPSILIAIILICGFISGIITTNAFAGKAAKNSGAKNNSRVSSHR